MPNTALDTLLAHRSVRKFTPEKLTTDQVHTLIDAAQHSATSTFSQQYSILSVTNPAKLAVLGDITGHHWLEKAGHYFIFLVDQYRNQQLVPTSATTAENLHSVDKLLAGIFDATIATEAVVTAGESLGLGSTIMGSILNDVPRLIQLFDLPELTFPILGLAIGHPAEQPEQKPRLPQELIHFENQYQPITATEPHLVVTMRCSKHITNNGQPTNAKRPSRTTSSLNSAVTRNNGLVFWRRCGNKGSCKKSNNHNSYKKQARKSFRACFNFVEFNLVLSGGVGSADYAPSRQVVRPASKW